MKLGKISILLLLGILFVFAGCQEGTIETEVQADKRVPLVKGSQQTGIWKAFEYSMDYTYLYTQPKEGALGSMEFSGSIRKSPSGLDSLSIWILLLDGNGRVLEKKNIYDLGYRAERRMERSFTATVAVPPDTADISFAHTADMASGRNR